MTDRRAAIMKRGGIDPIKVDRRPLHQILNDYIPYGRWAMEKYIKERHGPRKNK